MSLGISVGLSLRGQYLSGAFDPASLFASGEEGAWYEPSTTTAFLSTTDLTPCGYGDECGFLLDKSQSANYSGGSFTGLGSELVSNPGGPFTTTTGYTITLGGGTVTVVSGNLEFSPASNGRLVTTLSGLTVGASYFVDVTQTGAIRLDVSTDSSGSGGTTIGPSSSVFVATAATMYLAFIEGGGQTTTIASVSVKELPGNHATQATFAARPILARVPEGGRRNLLEYTEEFDNAVWTAVDATIDDNGGSGYTDPNGASSAVKLVEGSANSVHQVFQEITAANSIHTVSFYVKAAERTHCAVKMYINGGAARYTVVFDLDNILATDTDQTGTPTNTSSSITDVGGGWRRCSVTADTQGTTFAQVQVSNSATPTFNASADVTYQGDGSSGVYIFGAQLEEASSATAYQKVVSEYDVTEDGVTSLDYLSFDGTDDFLEGTFPAALQGNTSKAIFAAADFATNQNNALFMLGENVSGKAFGIGFGGDSGRLDLFQWGGATFDLSASGQSATIDVFTGIKDGDDLSLRRGGSVIAGPTTKSSANITTADFTIGKLMHVSENFFSNKLYGLILRETAPTAQEVSDTESYLATKSGVTLP